MLINPKAELLERRQRQKLVAERLRQNLNWALAKSAFYQLKYHNFPIDKDSFSPQQMALLPVTTPQELESVNYFDLLTGPLSTTLRLSSNPSNLSLGFTQEDIARNLDIALRALASNELNKTSVVVIYGDYSSQTILDLHYAAEALGATVIPCGTLEKCLYALETYHPTCLLINEALLTDKISNQLPPHLIALVHKFTSPVLDKLATTTRIGRIYVEPVTGIAGSFFTCEHNHWHLQEDYFFAELLTSANTKNHTRGKLILTPMTLEATPLIRLLTTQMLEQTALSCDCGRTFTVYKPL